MPKPSGKAKGKLHRCKICGRWYRNYGVTRAHQFGVCSVLCLLR